MPNSDMEIKILSQIDQLNNFSNSDRKIENSLHSDDSKIDQEIRTILEIVEEQRSIINDFDVDYLINEIKEAINKKFQNENVKKLLLDRQSMNDELNAIKNDTLIAENKHKELSKKLEILRHRERVLKDMMESVIGESIC